MHVSRMMIGWWLLPAILAGCASSPFGGQRFPDYNVIRLYNDSPTEIADVELAAGGTTTVLERLPAEHSPVSDRGVSPDPPTATVSWRSAAGERIEREVPIARDVPPNFRGVILLRLQTDGDVDVRFVPYRELQ